MSIRTLLLAFLSLLLGGRALHGQATAQVGSGRPPAAGGDFVLRFGSGQDEVDLLDQLSVLASVPLPASGTLIKGSPADALPAPSAFEAAGRPRPLAGLEHQRYRQTLGGLPVLGAEILTHSRGGRLVSANGRFYRTQVLAAEPSLAAASATGMARAAHRQAARTPLFPGGARLDLTPARAVASAPELVYVDRRYPAFSGHLLLAWRIEVATPGTPDGRAYLLSAADGRILHDVALVAHGTVPGTVPTNYYGRQTVPVTPVAQGFELRDEERKIYVGRSRQGASGSTPLTSSLTDFQAEDERFGRMAYDIYFGADRMYDLLLARYDWRGIDGDGEAYDGVAEDSPYAPFVNAYWNGTTATFGQGDCHYGPLTSLDVVGHEFAHGITQRSSDLVYDSESGALNEAFSDIIGKSLERLVAPEQFTWELGNRFAASPYAESFRSMSDPTLFDNPKEVGGPFWTAGADVHHNSGPLNHWYYLLVEGGSGSTSTALPYAVAPLGLDAALDHVFALNTAYLTSNSTYFDAYEASLVLAADTYGPASPELTAITQAWRAIGLPQSGMPTTTGDDLEFVFAQFEGVCAGAEEVELLVAYRYRGETRPANTVIGVELRALPQQRLIGTYPLTTAFPLESGNFEFEDISIPVASLLPLPAEGIGLRLVLSGDTEPANDSTEAYIALFPEGVHLDIDSADPAFTPCTGESIGYEVNFSNEGCQAVYAPVTLTFADRDGTTLGTSTLELDGLRAGDYGRREYVEVNPAWASRVARVTATTPGDRADADNTAQLLNEPELVLPVGLTLTGSEVTDDAYLQVWTPEITLGSLTRATTRNLGAAWVSSGEGRTVYAAPCPDPAFAAASGYAPPPALLMCINNDAGEASSLEFDASALVGKPSATFGDLDGYRNTLAVRYGSGDLPPQFHQRPDSETASRIAVPIPAGYRGFVLLELTNATGVDDWASVDPELRDYDYWVIDNLSLRVASSVTEVGGGLRLSPNPTRHGFELAIAPRGGGEAASLRAYDALGRLRHVERVSTTGSTTHVVTSDWTPGLYTVTVEYAGGGRDVARVIVQ